MTMTNPLSPTVDPISATDDPASEAAPAPTTTHGAPGLGTMLVRRFGLVLIWALMIAALVVLIPGDVSATSAMRAVLGSQTPLVFLGLAVVTTMAVGEFDLSFASIYGLSAATVPALVVLHDWSWPAAAAAALAVVLVFGLVNAVLVVLVGINSVVVTLGVASVARGLAFFISGETTVSGLDPALSRIALDRFVGLPMIFWYGVILVAIAAYVMAATPLGRHMLFVGSNRNVALLAGIPVARIRMGAYLTSALICGIGGIIVSAGLGGFNPTTAETNLMPTFASVVLGTVAVVPGRFNPFGMLIAVYFLLTGVFGLQLLGLAGWVTNVFYGVALVVAVAASTLLQRRISG